uniref:Uncharacterized protein n=1 Tax=Leersia perrieri TaxID=77586 RepID=A0A0D9XAA6_9ORYZ
MEATAVSVGKSVLDGALSYAKSAIAEEVTLQLGVQKDQRFIRDELEMMLSFLRAADKEHAHHDEVLKTWVKQVRDVAYDVEDCLQDYIVQLERPSWWSRRLSCTTLKERHHIATMMKDLRAKVEDVSQRNSRYQLISGLAADASEPSHLAAAELQSTNDEAIRVAKQEKKVDLVHLITKSGGSGLQVIALWGNSRASAIWLAYQQAKVEFECHAWVKLTHPFDAKEFIGSLVRQFKANSQEVTGKAPQGTPSVVSVLDEMEAKGYNLLSDFSGYVTNKKYLIVLNGLSTIEELDWINACLPYNDNGSRILVCTQQDEVASFFNETGHKVSEMQQEQSFVKPLFIFYKEDSSIEQKYKAESSSNSTSTTGSTEDGNNPILDESKPTEWVEPESEVTDQISKPESEVMDLLSKGGKVIAVWGNDLEKSSAVVRNVYERLGGCFQKHAWFSMKPEVSHEEFLKDLDSQLDRDYCESTEGYSDHKQQEDARNSISKEGNTESTRKLLASKISLAHKFLFVFNNISSIQEWDSIAKRLPIESNPANRIIVTTRESTVAIHCSGENQYKLEGRNDKTKAEPQSVGLDSTEMKSETKSCMSSSSTANDKKKVHFDDEMITEDNVEVLPESCSPTSYPLNRDSNNSAAKKFNRSRSTIAAQEDQLIGRVKEKKDLLELLSSNSNHQVISVWGMGGIGKTTLVKSIYQSSELEQLEFKRRAWVTVQRPFQPTELLRSLAQHLGEDSTINKGGSMLGLVRNDLSTMGSKELSDKLKDDLTGKKYLIVLDDMSSYIEWDFIIKKLPESNDRRIIVTTRPESVARYCSKTVQNMHKIEGLTDEDALELFLNKVSNNDEDKSKLKQKRDMMEEAHIIIKKCGRLPLAIAAVGGFLTTRPPIITEWRKFSDHLSTELDENPSLEKIKKILISSYEGLSYHLKSCFLYLSIFPEDHNIRYGRLLRRWIAEGYSRPMRNKNAEKEAEEQFTGLLNKSMIQQSRTVTTGKTGFFQLHDLMREISIAKSEEENLVLVLDDHSISSSKDKVRHLVVSQSWSREKNKNDMENIVDVSHIRSLTVFGEWRSFFLSKKMRMLRVLDLEDVDGLQDPDLASIGKLRHLKYLSIRGCEKIINLPSSVGNLLNLETLDIRGTCVTKLPATIGRLQNLKYLRAGPSLDDEDDTRSWVPNPLLLIFQLISEYRSIQEEVGIKYASSLLLWLVRGWLRNLDLYGVKVPRGIGRLRFMHTLSVVNIARGNALLKNLKKLTQLRKLGVTGINKKNCKELCSAIADHGCLQSLLLRAEGKAGLQGCLDDLSPPPGNLESLQLYGNLVTLPEWIKRLENLQKLSLRSTNLEADATMEVLGGLPMLAILRLQDNACRWDELRIERSKENELQSEQSNEDELRNELSKEKELRNERSEEDEIQNERIKEDEIRNERSEENGLRNEQSEKHETRNIQRNEILFRPKCFEVLTALELISWRSLKSVVFEKGATPKLEVILVDDCTNIDDVGFSGIGNLATLKEVSLQGNYFTSFKEELQEQLDLIKPKPNLKFL